MNRLILQSVTYFHAKNAGKRPQHLCDPGEVSIEKEWMDGFALLLLTRLALEARTRRLE